MQVKLIVLSGSHEGKEIPIKQDKFLIGRSESCQLRPKSESISRKHCAFVQKDGRVLLVDLKSRNGTFVNDKQLSPDKAKILKSGDKLRVGQLDFQIIIEVGIGGAKKPEVKDVKDAAARMAGTAATSDSKYEQFDVNSWLEEADQVDRSKTQSDSLETRQYLLDETTRLDDALIDSIADSVDGEGKPESGVRPDKRSPVKLPKSASRAASGTSRDAAQETLKRYFGGRN